MAHLEKIETLPELAAKELGLPGAIVIGVMEDGSIIVKGHGITLADQVTALAVSIHAVLSEHDRLVLSGEAGEAAQAKFERFKRGLT